MKKTLYSLQKKETRLNLRKAIKTNISDCNIRANNEMMAANFRDPMTAMITVKDKEYRGDAQVLHIP
jgi:hypothetical protein